MITVTSVLNIASMASIRGKVTDDELLEFAGILTHAYKQGVLEEVAEMFEEQHTWITNVAAANLVRNMKG